MRIVRRLSVMSIEPSATKSGNRGKLKEPVKDVELEPVEDVELYTTIDASSIVQIVDCT